MGAIPDAEGPFVYRVSPSPGAANPAVSTPTLLINEVSFSSAGTPIGNPICAGKDWVELVNLGAATVSLHELRLTNSSDPLWHAYQLENANIAAGAYITFCVSSDFKIKSMGGGGRGFKRPTPRFWGIGGNTPEKFLKMTSSNGEKWLKSYLLKHNFCLVFISPSTPSF
jgi:hypothetical protein